MTAVDGKGGVPEDISDEALEAHISAWYERRPGAEFGDGEGISVAWPRR